MDEHRVLDYALVVMKNLNLIIILYMVILMSYCLGGVVQENSALAFLSKIDTIPLVPWKVPVLAVLLYGACLLLMYIRGLSGFALMIKAALELAVCFGISYLLGFTYTGMVLLVLADTMRDVPKMKRQFSFAVVICLFYLILDFDLFSIFHNIIPFDTYLEYYQRDSRAILLGVRNIIASLNTLLFILYMILLVRVQMSEKERIMSLNEQLNSANDELQRANVRLEEYARESVKMTETKERNRLAREIHDTLGHALTGIITGIEACTALMDVAPEATKIQLSAIAEVARQGVTDVRRSVKALRPDALEKFDLANAISRTINEMCTAANVEIEYICEARLDCFTEDEEDMIYRIIQESITNSIRHGKADYIWITIQRELDMLKICIRDNGIGCAEIQKGFGLHHMEERLNMLNGSLSYSGTNGFVVEAVIPIRWGNGGTKR